MFDPRGNDPSGFDLLIIIYIQVNRGVHTIRYGVYLRYTHGFKVAVWLQGGIRVNYWLSTLKSIVNLRLILGQGCN